MNQAYQSILSAGIEKRYRMLEEEIMKDVIRRIQKAGKITATADWQLQRYMVLGHSTEDVENIIRQAVGGDWADTFRLYDEVIEQEYIGSRAMYEQVNTHFVPYEQNYELQQITNALIQQSNDELSNISRSLGFMVDMGNGRLAFTPLAEIYNGYIDNAIVMMASGAFDYNTLIRRVVGEMTASGLRTVDYASGRSNRVDVAARRALLTGMGQLTGHIADRNGALLGTDKFEVDWHPGARPSHAVWQGRVWTRQQLVEICGLGSGAGLLGWHCHHTYYPFIEGISVRNYSDEWLAEMDRKEAQKIPYRGKEYNTYEATQKQRQMETAMRAQREKVQLLKQGGADPDDILNARCKYQAMLDEYKEFSKKFNLPEQRERIYADLHGRVAPSQHTYKKWQEERTEKAAKRAAAAERRAERQMREQAEKNRRADMDAARKSVTRASESATINLAEEYRQNAAVIRETLHGIEEARRTLRYEVGTVIDRTGNIISVTEGEAHSVSPPVELLSNNIFTHNHPSGGCFSDTDIRSMIDTGLFECRASTPQGTFFSLMRKDGVEPDPAIVAEYARAADYEAVAEKIIVDIKNGILKPEELTSAVYTRYIGEVEAEWLEKNAGKYGLIFVKGVV